jgi:hypothetical protein
MIFLTDMMNMKHVLRAVFFAGIIFISLFGWFGSAGADEQAQTGEAVPPIDIEKDFTQWQSIPDTATFTRQFNPYYFNKEEKGSMKALPISESVFWGYNGTRVKEVKALMAPASFYFYLSTFAPMSRGLIFFMYLHKGRDAGTENEYTIEIDVNDIEGENDVLLWTFGTDKPSVIGKCKYDTNELQGEVVFARLPEALGKGLVKFYSFDLTTCFFERAKGFYEEFFYTSIWFRDIPTEDEL